MKLDTQPRPKLTLPRTNVENLLDLVTAPIIVLGFVVAFVYWNVLPAVIASHFDLSGQPNGWSSKSVVWIIALLNGAGFVAITVTSRFPHTYNYMWPITEENAARQYLLARKFLAVMKFESAMLMFLALWNVIQVGIGARTHADSAQLCLLFFLMIVSCVMFVVVSYTRR